MAKVWEQVLLANPDDADATRRHGSLFAAEWENADAARSYLEKFKKVDPTAHAERRSINRRGLILVSNQNSKKRGNCQRNTILTLQCVYIARYSEIIHPMVICPSRITKHLLPPLADRPRP